jgi:hypothetical protein
MLVGHAHNVEKTRGQAAPWRSELATAHEVYRGRYLAIVTRSPIGVCQPKGAAAVGIGRLYCQLGRHFPNGLPAVHLASRRLASTWGIVLRRGTRLCAAVASIEHGQ